MCCLNFAKGSSVNNVKVGQFLAVLVECMIDIDDINEEMNINST